MRSWRRRLVWSSEPRASGGAASRRAPGRSAAVSSCSAVAQVLDRDRALGAEQVGVGSRGAALLRLDARRRGTRGTAPGWPRRRTAPARRRAPAARRGRSRRTWATPTAGTSRPRRRWPRLSVSSAANTKRSTSGLNDGSVNTVDCIDRHVWHHGAHSIDDDRDLAELRARQRARLGHRAIHGITMPPSASALPHGSPRCRARLAPPGCALLAGRRGGPGRRARRDRAGAPASCRIGSAIANTTKRFMLRVIARGGGSRRSGSGLAAASCLALRPRLPARLPAGRQSPRRVASRGMVWCDAMSSRPPEQPETTLGRIMDERRGKATALRDAGSDPFRNDVGPAITLAEVRQRYEATRPVPVEPPAPRSPPRARRPRRATGATGARASRRSTARSCASPGARSASAGSARPCSSPMRDATGDLQLYLNVDHLDAGDFAQRRAAARRRRHRRRRGPGVLDPARRALDPRQAGCGSRPSRCARCPTSGTA